MLTRQRKIMFLLVVCFLFAVITLPSQLPAAPAAPYYEGKTITIIVGYGPGGGNDRMARLLQKHLPKHIPGKPTIIVQNMEGGGTIICTNHIYNVSKPDGLTIGAVSKALVTSQVIKEQGVKFDLKKIAWVGSAAIEATVLVMRSDLPFKTVEDIRKSTKPLYMPAAGPATVDQQFVVLLNAYAGFDFKIVQVPSSSVAHLQIEQKEADGRAGSYSSVKPFIDRGVVRPMMRGRVSEPGIENLPVNEDLTSDKTGKLIMGMCAVQDITGRPYVCHPATPDAVMNILREAFAKVAKDPEAIEEATKMKMTLNYIPAEECRKAWNYILDQPEDIIKEYSKHVKF